MSKVYRHLYSQVYDWENLMLAWRKARRGKRGQPPAATFEMNLDWNLLVQNVIPTQFSQPSSLSCLPDYVTLNGSYTKYSVQRIANEVSRIPCPARCFISVEIGLGRNSDAVLCAVKSMHVGPIQHDKATPGFSLGPKDAAAPCASQCVIEGTA